MAFNFSHKYRFPIEISVSPGKESEVTTCAKVLGVMVSNDLKWTQNTAYITDKARQRLWILRKLDKLGLSKDFILDVYTKEIRSLLEYSVPVWNGALTLADSLKIEKIQKIVLKLLLKDNYFSYTEACKNFKLEKLHERRVKLCLNFSKKEFKKPNGIFKKYKSVKPKRQGKRRILVEEPTTRTVRYAKSSIPYLSKLLNAEANKDHTRNV